jgi:hypothetical protein
MIDPMVSLTFALHSDKGGYALLLGSGVSRSAGIPTGWDIVLDLIKQIAAVSKENCGENPEAWYVEKYGKEPNYSELLGELAKTSSARNRLLRSYFEPTGEDRAQGLKVPKQAHFAIAELVAKGFVRVIITTNFDKLLESAIESLGITPTIIATPDAAEGAMPINHERCTLIKLHGDYLDSRIKNTPNELEAYDERIDKLLDRIFDEYGLIICGWSAEWDKALRSALERCKSHRFTTFWTYRSAPKEQTKSLIELRRAEAVNISDADTFFNNVKENVLVLDDLEATHPASPQIAVKRLKKYLVEEKYRIDLHDLISGEVEKLYEKMSEENFPLKDVQFRISELEKRIGRYKAISETVISLIINGCYWDKGIYTHEWIAALNRIASPERDRGGIAPYIKLKYYPALLLFYASSIASIAGSKYNTFASIFIKARWRKDNQENSLPLSILPSQVIETERAKQIPSLPKTKTPISDLLFSTLRKDFIKLMPDENRYLRCFDRFEYLYALYCASWRKSQGASLMFPPGRFAWRRYDGTDISVQDEIGEEIREQGIEWPLIKNGLFGDSAKTLLSIKDEVDALTASWGWSW